MWFHFKKKSEESLAQRKVVSVRLEAIGGQGANSAGKILAEAAVLGMGFTGNHFSSFGSEKRGSPVRSFVRFSTARQPVRTASFIKVPDVLVIFHESLLQTHQEVLEGVGAETDIIINSSRKPHQMTFPKNLVARKIITVDATTLAMKYKCGLNAVMLGAISQLVTEISTEQLTKTLKLFFSKLPEKVQAQNEDGFKAGADKFKKEAFSEKQSIDELAHSPLPEMGWLNAPIGGVIVNPGNSILKDHSASRKGIAPQFKKEICFNCGFCDMVCPDFCFVWQIDKTGQTAPQLQGIDYQYCKGCQKCISVCPVEALVPALESELTAEEKSQKLYPEINNAEVENRWRKQDWAHYIEDLSDQEKMMTLQTELLNAKTYLRPDFSELPEVAEQIQKQIKMQLKNKSEKKD